MYFYIINLFSRKNWLENITRSLVKCKTHWRASGVCRCHDIVKAWGVCRCHDIVKVQSMKVKSCRHVRHREFTVSRSFHQTILPLYVCAVHVYVYVCVRELTYLWAHVLMKAQDWCPETFLIAIHHIKLSMVSVKPRMCRYC